MTTKKRRVQKLRPTPVPPPPCDSDGLPRRIRIIVADDQAIDRHGLMLLLGTQTDLAVVGDATSGKSAVERCRELEPDVLLLDIRMPGIDGVSAIPQVRSASPNTRILAVAEHGEARCLALNPPRPPRVWDLGDGSAGTPVSDCLALALANGAHGTIRRSAEPEDLFQAVRALASGHAWYESGTAARLHRRPQDEARGGEALSARELEVAGLIGDGRSNKEIAAALRISDRTVKKHVGQILHKLHLEDRLQIGLFIARNPLFLTGRLPAAR